MKKEKNMVDSQMLDGKQEIRKNPIDDIAFLFSLDSKNYLRLKKEKIKCVRLIVKNMVLAFLGH